MKNEKYNAQKIIENNINNIIVVTKKYKEKGVITYLKNNYIEVIFRNNLYKLKVKKSNNNFYWYLKPYKNKFFETKIDNNIQSLELIFNAICDDEKYRKDTNNI